MKSDETWKYIHAERAAMADTWTDLSPGQWATSSWCTGWTVQDTAGHVVAAAEQTPLNFYRELISPDSGSTCSPIERPSASERSGRTN
jgi:hypothetical protein